MTQPQLIPVPPQTQARKSTTFRPPPIDSSLTLPQIYDWQSQQSAAHRLFVFTDIDGKLNTITWSEGVAAVYTGARILRNRLSSIQVIKRPVIAILSTSDTIPYFITMIGILRADMTCFPISPRNSAIAVAHLLSKVEVDHVLVGHDSAMESLLKDALHLLKVKTFEPKGSGVMIPTFSPMLTFEDLFLKDVSTKADASDLPLKYTDPNEIVMYLHSSGSTAFPKPIPWTNHRLIQLMHIPWFGGQDLTDQIWSLHVMPMYHGMGVLQLCWTASCGLVVASFLPKNPAVLATPENLFLAAKATNSEVIFCVPSFIEAWAKKPEYVQWLSTRNGVLYGGGPLNKEAGDLLTKHGVSIYILYGSTEGGIMSPIIPARGSPGYDWNYFTFPALVTPEMIPSGDGSYEFVMVSNTICQPSVINTNVNGVPAYATSDLMLPHPTKEGYWRIFGRTDDQIMHNTGEKTNPGPLENMMNQDPHVKASVMFGRGQFHAGIIVEPRNQFTFDPSDEEKLSQFRNQVWPTVEKMNNFAPQHSRLFKEEPSCHQMILVASPAKPFTYTAKNTARRQAILNDYDKEIERLYETVDESTQAGIPPPEEWDLNSTVDFVRVVLTKVLQRHLNDDDDIFEHGCDSLQATWIRNTLLRALRQSAEIDSRNWTTLNFVYEYPTIHKLSRFLIALTNGMWDMEQFSNIEASKQKVKIMEAMVVKYSNGLPSLNIQQRGDRVILVTGTTGALGCHLLTTLLADGEVSRIYALNRKRESFTPLERQIQAFTEREIDTEQMRTCGNKLVVLDADLTQDDFGIDSNIYEDILESVTHVLHNGKLSSKLDSWRVDFNLSLTSFESNIKGLRNLIALSLMSGAQLIYTSTIGIFQNVESLETLEENWVSPEVAVGTGYTESKWISEKLIRSSMLQNPLIIRVGQLTGDAKYGVWNQKEWVPAMIRSATMLGCLPDESGLISWIPVDYAAHILVNYIRADFGSRNSPSILHLAHPNPISWSTIAEGIRAELGNIALVPYAEWLARLEEKGPQDTKLPATRLLPFYRALNTRIGSSGNYEAFGMPRMVIEKGAPTSVLPSLSGDDASRWIRHWK
ncbi:acetyl-CoA synthetase-like protein [Dendrothele bispora CBS 962.96]|uniref:Acetyl-CoA synthetase-like protein n=1 Tax=Dendrothele bispora (strain CBS 962.96) TaxID=1314807 RepID=A0A4S8MUU3_DENBC|nr:acetyl-CoA synthetase-like protein [Dendrothele bispora CBS 962.96]